MSPFAAPARALACACATTLVAVISPLKTLRLFTSADAVALASTSVAAEALAFAEPVLTIGACVAGSSPYANPPLNSTWSFGAETVGVAAASRPGMTIRIAWARAVAPAAWPRLPPRIGRGGGQQQQDCHRGDERTLQHRHPIMQPPAEPQTEPGT